MELRFKLPATKHANISLQKSTVNMNGDVEMQNAEESCDTVAILDAGAQYGKVTFTIFVPVRYVETPCPLVGGSKRTYVMYPGY